jgi:hypothetical protein
MEQRRDCVLLQVENVSKYEGLALPLRHGTNSGPQFRMGKGVSHGQGDFALEQSLLESFAMLGAVAVVQSYPVRPSSRRVHLPHPGPPRECPNERLVRGVIRESRVPTGDAKGSPSFCLSDRIVPVAVEVVSG